MCNTSRYKNNTAPSAWFCVEALTRRFVASQVRMAAISEAPISEGCRFR
jgi:hypothetical protein